MWASLEDREAGAALRTRARAVKAETRRLLARSRQLCRRRHLAGGSDDDVPRILETVGVGALCLDCLVRKSGLSTAATLIGIARMRRTVQVRLTVERCDGCLERCPSYRLG